MGFKLSCYKHMKVGEILLPFEWPCFQGFCCCEHLSSPISFHCKDSGPIFSKWRKIKRSGEKFKETLLSISKFPKNSLQKTLRWQSRATGMLFNIHLHLKSVKCTVLLLQIGFCVATFKAQLFSNLEWFSNQLKTKLKVLYDNGFLWQKMV